MNQQNQHCHSSQPIEKTVNTKSYLSMTFVNKDLLKNQYNLSIAKLYGVTIIKLFDI